MTRDHSPIRASLAREGKNTIAPAGNSARAIKEEAHCVTSTPSSRTA